LLKIGELIMDERQTVAVNYSAKDADGVEVVGVEVRLGKMKLEDAKVIEKLLLQALMSMSK